MATITSSVEVTCSNRCALRAADFVRKAAIRSGVILLLDGCIPFFIPRVGEYTAPWGIRIVDRRQKHTRGSNKARLLVLLAQRQEHSETALTSKQVPKPGVIESCIPDRVIDPGVA
jgi:hypothetical protein